jgi:hypothetical protein
MHYLLSGTFLRLRVVRINLWSAVLALPLLRHLTTTTDLLALGNANHIRLLHQPITLDISHVGWLPTRHILRIIIAHGWPDRLEIMILFGGLDRLNILLGVLPTLHPVVICGLELDNSLLEHFLITDEFLHFKVAVFSSVILQYLQTLSQVFILILELVDFLILLINQL